MTAPAERIRADFVSALYMAAAKINAAGGLDHVPSNWRLELEGDGGYGFWATAVVAGIDVTLTINAEAEDLNTAEPLVHFGAIYTDVDVDRLEIESSDGPLLQRVAQGRIAGVVVEWMRTQVPLTADAVAAVSGLDDLFGSETPLDEAAEDLGIGRSLADAAAALEKSK